MPYTIRYLPKVSAIMRRMDRFERQDLRALSAWIAADPTAGRRSYKDMQGRWWRSFASLGLIVFYHEGGRIITVGDVWRRETPDEDD